MKPAANGKNDSGSADAQSHTDLRLWLRLLACTRLIENHIRSRIRDSFDTTLPRFDLMAQLARHPEGLKMGELSQAMMVTGGNVTGITDQLEKDGLVERVTMPGDRRAWKVRLTDAGREVFISMASEHETWIVDLVDGLSTQEKQQLYTLLGQLKQFVREKVS
jgi:DNA-binding MarR family transcriptional regulator